MLGSSGRSRDALGRAGRIVVLLSMSAAWGCGLNREGEGAYAAAPAADASDEGFVEDGAGEGGAGGWPGQDGQAGTAGAADAGIDASDGPDSAVDGDAADASEVLTDVAGEESPCQPGLTECGASCVDTSQDLNHCGGCGNSCAGSNASCQGGQCSCTPQCAAANACGSDGCGGSCGSCVTGWTCWSGYCVKEWATTGAWSCYEKCGGNTAANPDLECVGSDKGDCGEHETMCYCWCPEPGTCSI